MMESTAEVEITTNTDTELTNDWVGGMGMIFVRGTSGGVTTTLQIEDPAGGLQDQEDWISGNTLAISGVGHGYFNVPKGAVLSVNTSGGVGSDVFVSIHPLIERN